MTIRTTSRSSEEGRVASQRRTGRASHDPRPLRLRAVPDSLGESSCRATARTPPQINYAKPQQGRAQEGKGRGFRDGLNVSSEPEGPSWVKGLGHPSLVVSGPLELFAGIGEVCAAPTKSLAPVGTERDGQHFSRLNLNIEGAEIQRGRGSAGNTGMEAASTVPDASTLVSLPRGAPAVTGRMSHNRFSPVAFESLTYTLTSSSMPDTVTGNVWAS